jgi:hypothetical protein
VAADLEHDTSLERVGGQVLPPRDSLPVHLHAAARRTCVDSSRAAAQALEDEGLPAHEGREQRRTLARPGVRRTKRGLGPGDGHSTARVPQGREARALTHTLRVRVVRDGQGHDPRWRSPFAAGHGDVEGFGVEEGVAHTRESARGPRVGTDKAGPGVGVLRHTLLWYTVPVTLGHPRLHLGVSSGDQGLVCPQCVRSGAETGAVVEQRCLEHDL